MTSIPVRPPLPHLLLVAVLAGGAALSYVAWLGWDRRYDLDPVTGTSSGPYEAWQVVGGVVTLAALAVLAGLLGRPGLAVGVIPVVVTSLWSRDAAVRDDSGLWVVGAVLLACGLLTGVAAVASLADGVRRRRAGGTGRRGSARP